MASQPSFAATPKIGQVAISTADTNLVTPTNAGTVVSAGVNGTRISNIIVKATGTTTAGMVRLFLHDGTNFKGLIYELAVAAKTASGTSASFSKELSEESLPDILPLILPTGWSLRATTHNAEAFSVIATGADI